MTPGCPGCRSPLPPEVLGADGPVTCPSCRAPVEVEVFPALARTLRDGTGTPLASSEGDSTCFYHAGYRAAVPCDACGRFLCHLCDLPIGARHLCPECVHRSMEAKSPGLVTERMLWDRMAMSLAILPIFTFYFTLLTAPAAIVIALRHWKTPGSLVAPGRWRFVVALAFATLQLGGWTALIYFFAREGFPPAED